MISFKEFLTEKPSLYNAVDVKLLADSLKKKHDVSAAVKQINEGNIIYRGMPAEPSFFFHWGYTGDHVRQPSSINGNNFHALLAALPSWADINTVAPRNKAVICTTNVDKAKSFGSPYVILPINKTVLVVSPLADIHQYNWPGISGHGQRYGGLSATSISKALPSLLTRIFGSGAGSTAKGAAGLITNLRKTTLEMIEKVIADSKGATEVSTFKHFANMMTENPQHKTLFDCINDLMSPANAEFSLKTIGDTLEHDKELWFNNKFAAVKMVNKSNAELEYFCKTLKLELDKFIL